MKKYWFLIPGLILIFGGIIYISINHRRWLRKFYLTFITKNLVYSSTQLNGSLNYRLFTPQNIKSKKLPLVLYLHGGGQRGYENRKQLDYAFYKFSSATNQKNHPSFVLAPQCSLNTNWINYTDKNVPFGHYSQDSLTESVEIKLIIALVKEMVADYPIDESRIYTTGFSMGATAVWDIITRYPDLFAAALPMSGETDPTKASLITHLPIWAFHGADDEIVPWSINKNMVDEINKHGGNAKFTILKSIGHGCVHKTMNEKGVLDWIYNQNRVPK